MLFNQREHGKPAEQIGAKGQGRGNHCCPVILFPISLGYPTSRLYCFHFLFNQAQYFEWM